MSVTERKFLHDLSSPCSINIGMLEVVVEDLRETMGKDASVITRLEKALHAAQKMQHLIKERRNLLIGIEADAQQQRAPLDN